jgi:hypothetical protein
MKYYLGLMILSSLIAFSSVNAQDKRDFKSFFAEGHELRMNHIEKMHQLKIEHLEKATQQKKDVAQKIFALENKLEPGNKELNQGIREEIRKIRQESRENSKLSHQAIRESQKEYREAMKNRRSALKGLQMHDGEERGPRNKRRANRE